MSCLNTSSCPWQPLSTVALSCYIPLHAAAPASLCCLSPAGRPDMHEPWPELPLCCLVNGWSQHAPPGCPSAPGQPSQAFQEPGLLGLQAVLFLSLGSLHLSDLFCIRFVWSCLMSLLAIEGGVREMSSMFIEPYFLNQNGLVGHLNIVLATLKFQSLLKIIIHHNIKMLIESTLLHFSFLKNRTNKKPKTKHPNPH